MHTVVEMPEFVRRASKLGITEDEMEGIINELATNPQAGEEMPGTGGARKIRFAAPSKNRGKSGGYRVITFYSGPDIPVFLLIVYGKGEQVDLTQDQKNNMKANLKLVVEIYKEDQKRKRKGKRK